MLLVKPLMDRRTQAVQGKPKRHKKKTHHIFELCGATFKQHEMSLPAAGNQNEADAFTVLEVAENIPGYAKTVPILL